MILGGECDRHKNLASNEVTADVSNGAISTNAIVSLDAEASVAEA
jgi:hypothetical protein